MSSWRSFGTFEVNFPASSNDGFLFHVNATGTWWRYDPRQRYPKSAAESYVIDQVSRMASNYSVLATVALERKINASLGRRSKSTGLGTRVRWASARIEVDPEVRDIAYHRMQLRARKKEDMEDRRLHIAQAVELRDLLREDSTLALAHLLLVAPEKIESLTSSGAIKTVGEQIATYAPGATWVKTAQLLEKSFGEMPDDAKQAIVDRICKVLLEFGQKKSVEHLQKTYRQQ